HINGISIVFPMEGRYVGRCEGFIGHRGGTPSQSLLPILPSHFHGMSFHGRGPLLLGRFPCKGPGCPECLFGMAGGPGTYCCRKNDRTPGFSKTGPMARLPIWPWLSEGADAKFMYRYPGWNRIHRRVYRTIILQEQKTFPDGYPALF